MPIPTLPNLPDLPSNPRSSDKRRVPTKPKPAASSRSRGEGTGSITEEHANKRRNAPQRRRTPAPSPKPRVASPNHNEQVENGYKIDKKTGKKYKTLSGVDPKTVRTMKNGAASINALKLAIQEDENFSNTDTLYGGLNELADTFLAHLRVPPNKEEIEKLRREKVRLSRIQQAEWESNNSAYNDEDEGSF